MVMIDGPWLPQKRIDERVGERIAPTLQVCLHLAPGREGSLGAARIHDQKDLIGGHQMFLSSFLSLHGS
jgi:hypothetical protein